MCVWVPHCPPQTFVPPTPSPPGSPRWGRDEGCDFVVRSARGWPSRYHCRKAQEQGCTFDNRMAAFCALSNNVRVSLQECCMRRGGVGPPNTVAEPCMDGVSASTPNAMCEQGSCMPVVTLYV